MCFQEKDPHDFETQANNIYQKAPAASKAATRPRAKSLWPPSQEETWHEGGHSLNTDTN